MKSLPLIKKGDPNADSLYKIYQTMFYGLSDREQSNLTPPYYMQGAYIINGFADEYGATNQSERAILIGNGSGGKTTFYIISPTKGILNYNSGLETWISVTRLASETIPLTDLAEKVLSAEYYWGGGALNFDKNNSTTNIQALNSAKISALENGASPVGTSVSSFKLVSDYTYLGIGCYDIHLGNYIGVAIKRGSNNPLYTVTVNGISGSLSFTPLLSDTTNAIKTTNITDKAVTRAKIADGAISTAQIAEKGIGGSRLNDKTITTDKIADKAVTRAILDDAVVGQIDQFQMIPQGADLLKVSLGKGVYFTQDEKYLNIPTGITGYNPMCMIVDNNGSRLLLGTSTTGDFICARKNSSATSWLICNYYNEIASKQNSTDKTLATTSKTIVGAINELQSSLGNISTVLTNIIGE